MVAMKLKPHTFISLSSQSSESPNYIRNLVFKLISQDFSGSGPDQIHPRMLWETREEIVAAMLKFTSSIGTNVDGTC